MTAPTLEPVEERALQDLETTLAGISTSSLVASFYTNVATVVPMDRAPLENIVLPAVVIEHVGTEHEFPDVSPGQYDSVGHVRLYLVINREPTWRRDLLRFAADVRRAVMVDAHRGAGNANGNVNCFDTLVSRTVIGEETEGMNQAVALLELQFQFRDSVDDLTQSA